MFVKVDLNNSPALVHLMEPDDFGRFHVEVASGGRDSDGCLSAGARDHLQAVLDESGIGRFAGEGGGSGEAGEGGGSGEAGEGGEDGGSGDGGSEDLFVEMVALKRLAGVRSAEWEAGFEKMIAYATSKGWTDPSGTAIRAHVEWSG